MYWNDYVLAQGYKPVDAAIMRFISTVNCWYCYFLKQELSLYRFGYYFEYRGAFVIR
jgi:hypothetical protein